ncbi:hypothetical protein JR316_0008621 [Psilocybe cubensis]|uniref:Uncharacterized protein n=1 Tax=Psilocybe cubensis TaxID=181762 RepID=A0ACB8GRK5_PSICU|nr:hypothetical protein JR316_0008621 [Psilocybe cubensis]KAH9478168.1 hypothetical protein JR316_0008621 [Psilocybe cubensis]
MVDTGHQEKKKRGRSKASTTLVPPIPEHEGRYTLRRGKQYSTSVERSKNSASHQRVKNIILETIQDSTDIDNSKGTGGSSNTATNGADKAVLDKRPDPSTSVHDAEVQPEQTQSPNIPDQTHNINQTLQESSSASASHTRTLNLDTFDNNTAINTVLYDPESNNHPTVPEPSNHVFGFKEGSTSHVDSQNGVSIDEAYSLFHAPKESHNLQPNGNAALFSPLESQNMTFTQLLQDAIMPDTPINHTYTMDVNMSHQLISNSQFDMLYPENFSTSNGAQQFSESHITQDNTQDLPTRGSTYGSLDFKFDAQTNGTLDTQNPNMTDINSLILNAPEDSTESNNIKGRQVSASSLNETTPILTIPPHILSLISPKLQEEFDMSVANRQKVFLEYSERERMICAPAQRTLPEIRHALENIDRCIDSIQRHNLRIAEIQEEVAKAQRKFQDAENIKSLEEKLALLRDEEKRAQSNLENGTVETFLDLKQALMSIRSQIRDVGLLLDVASASLKNSKSQSPSALSAGQSSVVQPPAPKPNRSKSTQPVNEKPSEKRAAPSKPPPRKKAKTGRPKLIEEESDSDETIEDIGVETMDIIQERTWASMNLHDRGKFEAGARQAMHLYESTGDISHFHIRYRLALRHIQSFLPEECFHSKKVAIAIFRTASLNLLIGICVLGGVFSS